MRRYYTTHAYILCTILYFPFCRSPLSTRNLLSDSPSLQMSAGSNSVIYTDKANSRRRHTAPTPTRLVGRYEPILDKENVWGGYQQTKKEWRVQKMIQCVFLFFKIRHENFQEISSFRKLCAPCCYFQDVLRDFCPFLHIFR